jgi:hypothetical protein
MSSTRENSQAQNFISVIFNIVIESLKSARLKNTVINDLSIIDQNQSVDSLLEKLASEIQNDSAAIDAIHSNLENYKVRINKAMTSTRPTLNRGDF